MGVRQDMAIAATAIKKYPITPEIRQQLVDKALAILTGSTNERNQIAAAKVLLAADGHNQKHDIESANQSNGNRFFEIAQRLGLRIDPPAIPEGPAVGDSGLVDGKVVSREEQGRHAGEGEEETQ